MTTLARTHVLLDLTSRESGSRPAQPGDGSSGPAWTEIQAILSLFERVARSLIEGEVAIYRACLMTKAKEGGTELLWHQDGGRFWGIDRRCLRWIPCRPECWRSGFRSTGCRVMWWKLRSAKFSRPATSL